MTHSQAIARIAFVVILLCLLQCYAYGCGAYEDASWQAQGELVDKDGYTIIQPEIDWGEPNEPDAGCNQDAGSDGGCDDDAGTD